MERKTMYIDIHWSFLLKLVALAVAIWAVFTLREILFMLFVVFIFVASVNPAIVYLQKYMSRSLAVTSFFVILLLVLMTISYLFIPSLVHQLNELGNNLPRYIEQLRPLVTSFQENGRYADVLDQAVNNVSEGIKGISDDLFRAIVAMFGGIAAVFSGLILAFYLLLEEKNAKEFFHQVLPQNRFKPVYVTVSKISERMGDWVRGQLLLMLLVGIANFISLLIIGIPSPLPLAIWAGLTEAIPYVGPVLGVIPAVIMAVATGSILKVVLVLAINFLLIQQLEANLAVPKIMGKAIGLSPVLVILSILVGVQLFGIIGAIIAIPAAAIVSVVIGEWSNLRKIWEEAEKDDDEALPEKS